MTNEKISWDNIEYIDKLSDSIITYLLYKEGKNIDIISRIRNISRESVEKDLIEAKIIIRELKESSDKTPLDIMLEAPKDKRLEILNAKTSDYLGKLEKEIKNRYKLFKNPEDKMILIWIAGELKARSLVPNISKDIYHYNGNVRRMVCSALGKIRDPRAVPILHRGLNDKKPQVRQYAAKALSHLGNKESLEILSKKLQMTEERDYVKSACINAINIITQKINEENT